MPSVWRGRDLTSVVVRHDQLLRGMATQQQTVISNLDGQPVVVTGRIPGSNPSSYGYQFLDPTSHVAIMFFGEDGTNGPGVFFFDANGNVVSKMDNTGTHSYDVSGHEITRQDSTGFHVYDTSGNEVVRLDATGLHVYNTAGTEEVAAGLLNSSPTIYGLGVLPYGGSTLQQVGGALSLSGLSASNVTNTSWTEFTGGSLTVEVGPSGKAVVSCGGYIATGTAGEHGYIGVSVDSGSVYSFADLGSGGGATAGTVGTTQTWSGLSAGTHDFKVFYETASNGAANCSFGAVNLTVQPL